MAPKGASISGVLPKKKKKHLRVRANGVIVIILFPYVAAGRPRLHLHLISNMDTASASLVLPQLGGMQDIDGQR